MGTTAQKLQYLVNAKAAIDTALTNKGVTPPAELGDYGTAIGTLGYKNKLQQIVQRTVTEITEEDLAGCTQIGVYGMQGCDRLISIVIPNTILRFYPQAFAYCNAFRYFIILNRTPIILDSVNSVGSVSYTYPFYVYTPDDYKVATNWSTFTSRIFPLVDTVQELVNIDTSVYTKAMVYGTKTEYTYNGAQWVEVA